MATLGGGTLGGSTLGGIGGYVSPVDDIDFAGFAPPPHAYRAVRPIVRLYSGDFLSGGIAKVRNTGTTGGGYNRASLAANSTPFQVTLPSTPIVGNMLVAQVYALGPSSVSITGFTTALQQPGSGGGSVAAILVREVQAGDGPGPYTVVATGATYLLMVITEYMNVRDVSPVFDTGGQIGAGGIGTTVIAGTVQPVDGTELAIAVIGGSLTGLAPVEVPYILPMTWDIDAEDARAFGITRMFSTAVSRHFAPIGDLSFGLDGDQIVSTAGATVLLAGNPEPVRFSPLGELDSAEGAATVQPYALGTVDITIHAADPYLAQVQPGQILEVFMPEPDAPWTFEWYIINHVSREFDAETERYTIQGLDLRSLINDRTLSDDYANAIVGTWKAETLARKIVSETSIVPEESLPYFISGNLAAVAGLTLEAADGLRGTTYDGPLLKSGAGVVETIATLYGKDRLGWRLVVLDPGTLAGRIEFQTFESNDLTASQLTNAAFSVGWDTARSMREVHDAVGALTVMTLYGSPLPGTFSTRQQVTVVDYDALAVWGVKHGFVDASNQGELTIQSAQAALDERKPKNFVELETRDTLSLQLKRDYWLLDQVTAVTPRGSQYDNTITQITMPIGTADQAISTASEYDLPEPVTETHAIPVGDALFRMRRILMDRINTPNPQITIGITPAQVGEAGRDRSAAAVRPIMFLTETQLQALIDGP